MKKTSKRDLEARVTATRIYQMICDAYHWALVEDKRTQKQLARLIHAARVYANSNRQIDGYDDLPDQFPTLALSSVLEQFGVENPEVAEELSRLDDILEKDRRKEKDR